MTCENSELRLEIGDGLYFPVLGNPEITDQLNAHGASCSVQIKVLRNATLPRQGDLAFLTRLLGATRTKVFGGICGEVNPDLGILFDKVSLTLFPYIEYCKQQPIQNYRYTDTLASHILRAGQTAGAYAVSGLAKNLLDILVNPDPDNNESFLVDFQNGDFVAFLDHVCSLRNCSWILRDTGALSISTLGIYNALLVVNTNNRVVDNAPRTELVIPENGQSTCDVFWQANTLKYDINEPIASEVWVLGKNGKNIPANGITSIPLDIKRYIAVADQTQYEASKTADELRKVLVTIGMADPVEFYKVLFEDLADPNNPIPTAGQSPPRCVYRKEEGLVYVNSTDVPANAFVQLIHITRFIKATSESATAIAYFKSVANGAGTGEKVHIEIREDITDQATAQALADSLLEVLSAFNFIINFGCVKVTGWKAGQQFRVRHPARNLDYNVTINTVKIKLRNGGRDYYNIDAGTIRIMSESDAQNKILETQANPVKAALPFASTGLYVE